MNRKCSITQLKGKMKRPWLLGVGVFLFVFILSQVALAEEVNRYSTWYETGVIGFTNPANVNGRPDDTFCTSSISASGGYILGKRGVNFIAAGTYQSGAGVLTVPWPTHQIDDIALLFVETPNEAVTLTTPAGFVEVTNSPQGVGTANAVGSVRLTVFWARATSAAMASPVLYDPTNHAVAVILTYRGVIQTGDPWDVTAGSTKTPASTSTTFPAVTTSVANELIVLAAAVDLDANNTNVWSAFTNSNLASIAERFDRVVSTGVGGGLGIADGTKTTAASTGDSTGTLTSSITAQMTIALKPDVSADVGTFIDARAYYGFDITMSVDDQVLLEYSPNNGTNWYTLKTYPVTPPQANTGTQRDAYNAPLITSWDDVNAARVRMRYVQGGSGLDGTRLMSVDDLFLQVSYSERYFPQDLSSATGGLNILNFDGVSKNGDAEADGDFTEAAGQYTFRWEDLDGLTDIGSYVQGNCSPVLWKLPTLTTTAYNFVRPFPDAIYADFTNGVYDKIHILAAVDDEDTSSLTFTVTYTDATTDTYTITAPYAVEAWGSQADNYAKYAVDNYNQRVAFAFDYEHYYDAGWTESNAKANLFHYTFDINEGKTLDKLTIPAEANLRVMAITLEKSPEYRWAYEYNPGPPPVTDKWEFSVTTEGGGSSISDITSNVPLQYGTDDDYVYEGLSSLKYAFVHAATGDSDYAWSTVPADPTSANDGTPPDSTQEADYPKNVGFCNQLEFWIKGAGPNTEDARIEIKDRSDVATLNKVTPTNWFLKSDDGTGYSSEITGVWKKVEIPFAAWEWQGTAINPSKEYIRWVGLGVNEDAEPNGPVAIGTFTFYVDNLRFYNDGTKHFIYEDAEKPSDGTWDTMFSSSGGGDSAVTNTVDTTTVYQGKDSLKTVFTHVFNGSSYSWWGRGSDNVAQESNGKWNDVYTGVDVRLYNQLEFWMKRVPTTGSVRLDLFLMDTNENSATSVNTEIHDFAGVKNTSDTNWVKVEIPLTRITWGSCLPSMVAVLGPIAETDHASFTSTVYFDNIQFAYDDMKLKWAYEEDDDDGLWDLVGTGAGTGSSIAVTVDTATIYDGSDSIKMAYSIINDSTDGWARALIESEDDRSGFDPADAASGNAAKNITPFNALVFYVYGDTGANALIEIKDYYAPTTAENATTNQVLLSSYVTVGPSWQKVTIPFSAWTWGSVDKSRIRQVNFYFDSDSMTYGSYNLYVDNVQFVNTYAPFGATAVSLTDFNAIGYLDKVKLSWKTESELDNIGFNILRSEDAKNYVKINKEIIPGLGTSAIGHEYAYEDTGVTNGKTYYYLLEDVESGGKLTKHGPVAAHPGADFDKDGMTDDWEYYYGLPATVADANADSDDDSLTNLQEFLAGTNPVVIDSENIPGISGAGGVKVIESSGFRTVLELDTSVFNAVNRVEGGTTYQLITLPEYVHGQTADAGKPQIPTKGILLGTSGKKPVVINILEYEKDTLAGYNIYPVPKTALTEDPNNPAIKRLTYEFYKDTNAYAVDAFYPGKLADVDYSNYLQDQQVIKVNFYPVQFNPARGTLELYTKIKLEVLQEGADLAAAVAAVTPKAAVPLTAGIAYKIYINENGIYRLTMPYLESQGISLSDADPRNLKIYNLGAEIPIYVSGSDYIEFYGQAVDTRYTGTNVYWLVLSDEPGLRMSASGQAEDATTTPGSFLETYKGEDNTLYWMEATGEDHWFIDAIYGSQVYNLTLNLNGVANSADEATVRIALEGSAYSGAEFTHHVYARLNGYPIADVTWQGARDYTINSKISQSYLNEGVNTVTLEAGADPTGFEEILVNWVEVSYRRDFTAKDDALAFGNYTGGAYKYQIGGFTDQDIEIYDITDPKGVQKITQFTVLPEEGAFAASFKDAGSKDYIVLAQDKAKVPAGILRDEPSNLADKKNRADYIIITHEDFYDTVLPFADYRSKQGLKVKVVKLGDIYDEFNYGIADIHAVKDFLKYAYDNWTGGRPNYVLLVGDATYDYRDYSGYGFTNYVPAYMVHSLYFGETGSDNWFVCFDGENDLIPDMLIGRFPIKTTDELKVTIDKIIRYEAISPDEAWTKKVLLVADNGEKIFTDTSEELASYLTKDYTADKQYLGTTTNSPAALKQGIIDSINEGRLFVNYTGHGGIGLWANERIFTWDDINSLYNRNALPVVTTWTCADGYFVYPRYIESLGERLVNDANGGAIAAFVPSGISYPTTQAYLAQGFYGAYFKDRDAILGSMVAKGKLNVYENEPGGDAANVIQTFVLFGDPALRVKMKAPQIPAVAAPAVFDLDKGKVNEIFRLTEEPEAAQAAGSTVQAAGSTVQAAGSSTDIVDKGRKGLTNIVREETAPVAPPSKKGSLGNIVPEEKGPGIRGVQLEDKTLVLAPPKWRVLSKSEYGALKSAKPYVNIDYSAIEKGVTDINKDASQLAELKTKFDKAVKDNDLQKASSIFSDITKLARKIYWRTF